MYTYAPSGKANTRIEVADVLRGLAIAGIVLIHFIEHMNFYMFPQPSSEFMGKVDDLVWDGVFSLLAGKMYAIFALLFGLSFFIQHDNQANRGVDFRPRFAWRMLLMMMLGIFDLCFYNGDILFVYAVCGLIVLPLIRCSDRVLAAVALVLALQPVELACIVYGILNPEAAPFSLGSGKLFGALYPALAGGSFPEVAAAGVRYGLPINILWAIENGRFTQNIMLFLAGVLLGRRRMFYDEGDNLSFWKRVCWIALAAWVVLAQAYRYLPQLFDAPMARNSASTLLNMWKNFATMSFYVSGVVLLFYRTRCRKALLVMAPYGRMSLTNYLGQSIVGALLFYGFGLSLFDDCGDTVSFLMGAAFVVLQVLFSTWWLKGHKRGPFEQLWSSLTWIGARKD